MENTSRPSGLRAEAAASRRSRGPVKSSAQTLRPGAGHLPPHPWSPVLPRLYSVTDDMLWGVNRRKKGATNTLAALKSIRDARPDGAPIYVILDNLSAHKGTDIRRWATKHKVELCFSPTYASWANPIEAHFGPLRQFTIANSNHTVQT
ncbi:mobile element protein [Streptomyces sp. L-9-10]|nr:mobile element protein [Streptomyces sp. L-9-10]